MLNFEQKANVFCRFYFRFARFYAAFNFRWAYSDPFSWRVHLGVDCARACSEKPFRASLMRILQFYSLWSFIRFHLESEPFARSGHMVQNKLHVHCDSSYSGTSKNKGTCTSPVQLSFVLKVPLGNLHLSSRLSKGPIECHSWVSYNHNQSNHFCHWVHHRS